MSGIPSNTTPLIPSTHHVLYHEWYFTTLLSPPPSLFPLSLLDPSSFLFILLLFYPPSSPSSPSSLSLFFLLFVGVICKCENVATGDWSVRQHKRQQVTGWKQMWPNKQKGGRLHNSKSESGLLCFSLLFSEACASCGLLQVDANVP